MPVAELKCLEDLYEPDATVPFRSNFTVGVKPKPCFFEDVCFIVIDVDVEPAEFPSASQTRSSVSEIAMRCFKVCSIVKYGR